MQQSETDGLSDGPECRHESLSSREVSVDENLSLDDAENPLQLLARASNLQLSPSGPRNNISKSSLPSSSCAKVMQNDIQRDDTEQTRSFFVPVKANLDIGLDIDPIEIGLVTFDEAESLFSSYVHPVADMTTAQCFNSPSVF